MDWKRSELLNKIFWLVISCITKFSGNLLGKLLRNDLMIERPAPASFEILIFWRCPLYRTDFSNELTMWEFQVLVEFLFWILGLGLNCFYLCVWTCHLRKRCRKIYIIFKRVILNIIAIIFVQNWVGFVYLWNLASCFEA